MIQKIEIIVNDNTCDVCGYNWTSLAQNIPIFCPNKKCRSREWNGKKQRKPQPARAVLPKPKRVRMGDDEF